MFFNDLSEIPALALGTGCAVFAVETSKNPKERFFADTLEAVRPSLRAAKKAPSGFFYLSPTNKPTITVEQVRDFTTQFSTKQTHDLLAVITPADAMSTAAQNAFLKSLEEPQLHVHYVLITATPSKLLPTILSRAQVFYLKTPGSLAAALTADPDIQQLAKQFIAASPSQLPGLATTVAKQKNAREYALAITATAIEILHKSYFKTKNPVFLAKIPQFIHLYDNLALNGHIKLHLVADLC